MSRDTLLILYHIYGSKTSDFVQCINNFFKLFSLYLNTISIDDNPTRVQIFLGKFTQLLFPDTKISGRFFYTKGVFFPNWHISIVHVATLLSVCLIISRQTALESSAGISTNLIPMSKTTFGTYHYSVITGHGKVTIPQVALGSLRGSLAFLSERSWRTVPVARCITNVSVCFIQLSKNSWRKRRLSCIKAGQERGF